MLNIKILLEMQYQFMKKLFQNCDKYYSTSKFLLSTEINRII